MQAFMSEDTDFSDIDGMPDKSTIRGTSTSTSCKLEGKKCTKTVKKTFTLSTGKSVALTKIVTKTFS